MSDIVKHLETRADLMLENKRLRDTIAALLVAHDEAEQQGGDLGVRVVERLMSFDIALLRRDAQGLRWVGIHPDDFIALENEHSEARRFMAGEATAAPAKELTLAVPSGLMRIVPLDGLPRGCFAQLRDSLMVPNHTRHHHEAVYGIDSIVRCTYELKPHQAVQVEIGR